MKQLLILAALLLLLVGCGESTQQTASPVPTTRPTLAPTTKPVSTPALLGSLVTAFTAMYGTPNDHTDVANGAYHYKRYADPSVVTDALIVQTDISDGDAYKQRVISVLNTPEHGGVTCEQFFPHDAHYVKQVTLTTGIDKIYSSVSLAKLFPTSTFTDASNNNTTPGLFDVLATKGACSVMVGTQQTA